MAVQLTPEQIQQLHELDDLHKQIAHEIERAASAGIDVADLAARHKAAEELRVGILSVYGGPVQRRRRT